MDKIEELQQLKSLLDQGAITEEEYLTLCKKIEPKKKEKKEAPPQTVITETSSQPTPDLDIIGNLNRRPENVVIAGKSIQSATGFQVASFICNFIGVIILVVSFFTGVSSFMGGGEVGDFLGDNPSFIFALILFLLGFIFRVISLSKFSKAGAFLKESEGVYDGRNIIKIIPSSQKIESNGLKIGQEFAGGIIAYFDWTGEYVGIVAKSDLPEKMNFQQARLACYKFDYEGYNDWFLPDRPELIEVYGTLHEKQLGSFKNENYWNNSVIKKIGHSSIVDFSKNEIFNSGYTLAQETDLNLVRPMRLIKIL